MNMRMQYSQRDGDLRRQYFPVLLLLFLFLVAAAACIASASYALAEEAGRVQSASQGI